jgi:hypothetical protein
MDAKTLEALKASIHHGMKDGEPTRVCRGWRALVSETLSTGGHFIALSTGSTDAALSRAQAEGR